MCPEVCKYTVLVAILVLHLFFVSPMKCKLVIVGFSDLWIHTVASNQISDIVIHWLRFSVWLIYPLM